MMIDEAVAGSGGGCFRAGTQVQLEGGRTVSIECLKEGDSVLSFDEQGNVHSGVVTKVHYHEDPQPILEIGYWRGKMRGITPNHWVQNQYGNFAEVGSLSTHDALIDGMGHLRPITGATLVGREPVWNLTVEPHHTFIADGIRVHNGGHRETFPVVAGAGGGGGGSKGGGGGHVATEDPDTLQSRAMVGILDVLGEGQIGGLVNDAQSIFLNGTPLMNPDGSYNFQKVEWGERVGTQGQSIMSGHDAVHTPFIHNVEVTTAAPTTFAISNEGVDAVRVIVTIPALVIQDTDDGDVHGTSVSYKFQVSTNGGPYYDQVVGRVWSHSPAGSGFTSASGYLTAYGPGGTTGISASMRKETGSPDVITWVQPQYWDDIGGYWVDLGPVKALTTKRTITKEYQNVLLPGGGWGDEYYQWMEVSVETIIPGDTLTVSTTADSSSIRFVPVWGSTGAGLVGTGVSCFFYTSLVTISGKTSSKYQKATVITLPKPGVSWNVRMIRITADSGSAALQNETWLDSYIEIVNSRLRYPNTAMVAIKLDSSQFSSIPLRSYLVDGILIKIPSNYNTLTGAYDGDWNGTFVTVASSNPAWVLYDLLTNRRYGLGGHIAASQVDKAKLYEIGKYCDEYVPTGYGGYEKRFTINTQIQGQTDAYKLVSDICSVFRGMAYWAGGMVGMTNDAPKDPTMVYGVANVIDGLFTYSGSARKDRHSVVLVTWNDPENDYKQEIEYVENADLIAKYGVKTIETVAFGCTSRGQARRAGLWILYTEQFESNIVTFSVGLDSALARPGEVIKINDPVRSGKRMAGRVISATTTSAVLDSAVTFTTSDPTISIRLPDGSFADRPVHQNAGTHTTLTWDSALPALPVANAMFITSEASLVPFLARVIGISEGTGADKGKYSITALEYNPGKFAQIENNKPARKLTTSIVKVVPNKVTGLIVKDSIYRSGPSIATKLSISWNGPVTGVKSWTVRVRRTKAGTGVSDNWREWKGLSIPALDVTNVTDGDIYTVHVFAVNVLNNTSATPALIDHTVVGKLLPPAVVTRFTSAPSGSSLKFTWDASKEIDVQQYEVRKTDSGWGNDDQENIVYAGSSNYFFLPANSLDATSVGYYIRALDTTGHYSTASASTTHTYVIPSMPGSLTKTISDTTTTSATVLLNWADSVSPFGVDKYVGKLTLPGAVIRNYSGLISEWRTALNWIGSATFEVYAIDKHGLKSPTASISFSSLVPNAPASCTVTPSIIGKLRLDWVDAVRITLPIAGYEIRSANSGWGTAGFVFKGAVSAFDIIGSLPVGTNTWYIKSFDTDSRYCTTPLTVSYNNVGPTLANVLNWGYHDTSTTSATIYFNWNDAVCPFGLRHYIVVLDKPGALPTITYKGNTSEWTTAADWIGDATITVTAVDNMGNTATIVPRTITKSRPNQPASITQTPLGSMRIKFDWNTPTKTSLPIAGYEVRSADSGWGTAGFLFRGTATEWTAQATTTSAPYVAYFKTFDSDGNYSLSATVATHDWVAPPNVTSVAVQRSGNLIVASALATKPFDFKLFEFRFGKVLPGATIYDDAGDIVPATGDIWSDPDVQVVQSVSNVATIDIGKFLQPRISTSGVTYRVACRMMDTSGNYSSASSLGSIVIKAL